ncbi:7TM diverse intracellular signaling domain-containing protein [Ramlibacter sp. PS3R-8]|uniref:sensor domain-containing diguanylate cyclase n=1 Tax=Ramlibacter sp. PS3R-8 TaxID=3133437 RepID=UPI0030965CAC
MRAVGAVLLWLVSSWGCVYAAGNGEAVAPAQPPTIVLGGDASVSLNRQSVYWADALGQRLIDQVEAGANAVPWRLRTRDQQSWPAGGSLWVMFEATVPRGERWYLETGAAIHDNLQFFHRDRSGAWVVQQAGTDMPSAIWSVPGRLPTFQLASDDPAPIRYWLRVDDAQTEFVSPLRLVRSDKLRSQREAEQFLFGAYFGLALLVFCASFAHGVTYRDKAFLAFALYIVLLASGQLGRAGVGAQHFWPEWLAWNGTLLSLWPGAAMAAGLWFVKVVTDPARLSRRLDLGVWALIAALLAATALHLVLRGHNSLNLVVALTGLALVAVLCMVVWGWNEGRERHLALVALGFAPLVLLALFPLARTFGLLPPSLLTRYGLFFGAALQLPILYYALNIRLMARREGELRASALSRSDALTGLPHLQALVERLDTSLAHARGQKQQLGLMAVRISNLDAIAEEFGAEYAERALVVAASHLRRVIVDFDMAARVGEREFALLLEAPVTPQLATSRAQQVVASGLRQVEALPAALTLKFHVAVALLPEPQLDGAASLRWVMEGLDQLTPDTRKLIRPLNF